MERKLRLVESPPIVEIKELTKTFDTVTALDDVSLEIGEGKIIGLLGSNGSGKTTMLKILAGLCMKYEGQVNIDGKSPGAFTKSKIAYLPDRSGLPEKMEVSEMIKIYRTFFDDFDEDKCRRLLNLFDIGLRRTTKGMSKGMTDKLQLALMMSRNARLYLLDEPLGGIDVEARDHVLDIILDNFNPQGTMIIVTHLIGEIERLFDEIIVLEKGRLRLQGSCDDIRAKYGNSLVDCIKEITRESRSEQYI